MESSTKVGLAVAAVAQQRLDRVMKQVEKLTSRVGSMRYEDDDLFR
jgi:hypothetical protein